MKLPRIFHRIYAAFAGYFWLPCPLCGNDFGGHEITGLDGRIWHSNGTGTIVCPHPDCQKRAKEMPIPEIFSRPVVIVQASA